jgi:hypothetical protein
VSAESPTIRHEISVPNSPNVVIWGTAEEVGFEPTVTLRPQRFSRPSDSSTLALLQLESRVARPRCPLVCSPRCQVGVWHTNQQLYRHGAATSAVGSGLLQRTIRLALPLWGCERLPGLLREACARLHSGTIIVGAPLRIDVSDVGTLRPVQQHLRSALRSADT